MSLVEPWHRSGSSYLFASVFLALFSGVIFLAVTSIDLAEPLDVPTVDSAEAAPASPESTRTTSEPQRSQSCSVVVIETVFTDTRMDEVRGLAAELGLLAEPGRVVGGATEMFIRVDSDSQSGEILETVRGNGWGDAYLTTTEPPLCQEEEE